LYNSKLALQKLMLLAKIGCDEFWEIPGAHDLQEKPARNVAFRSSFDKIADLKAIFLNQFRPINVGENF
jgi:hypothetical protein